MRRGATLFAALVLGGLVAPPWPGRAAPVSAAPPNVLLIVSDDQAWSEFNRGLMPSVYSDLVDHGVLFDRAYVETSECCPSRSEILTGLHEEHTGVDSNFIPLHRPTIAEALRNRGYRTMLAGKYLNSLTCDPRPEFDRWVCAGSPPSSYSLVDPYLNVDGTWTHFDGRYQTDVLASFVRDFVATTPSGQPFFAIYAPTTPHLPANDTRYADMPVAPWRPPSYDEDTTTDGKPRYLQRPPLNSGEVVTIDRDHTVMAHAVRSLDDSVGSILQGLGTRADHTLVVYVSDNGYLYGEHRHEGKVVPYEESVRVPMVVRYPPATGPMAHSRSHALVENVDIVPTIANVAGFAWGADGRSFLPLLDGSVSSVRDAVLLSRCNATGFGCSGYPGFSGVVTAGDAYVEYATGERELYDLGADPYELTNLAGDPGHAALRAQLSQRIADLRAPPAVQTTLAAGPGGPPGSRTARFRYFSQSRFATYACRLQRGSDPSIPIDCDGESLQLGPLPGGAYVFSVAGTDEHGAKDPTPAARAFSVTGSASDPVVSARDVRVTEGTGTSTIVKFAVTLQRASATNVTVAFDTDDGTATAPADYTSKAGTVTFKPGITRRTVSVRLVPDPVDEPDETLRFRLSNPQGAYLIDPSASATIADDDAYGPCTITGTPGPDVLGGTAGPDVICGLGGADLIAGRGGDDVLLGGGGGDIVLGGPGNDVLEGGSGSDTANFAAAGVTQGVVVSLLAGTGGGAEAGTDWFAMDGPRSTLEAVQGTPLDDRLTGDDGPNGLFGGAGADVLSGNSGDDRLDAGAGADTMRGGDGRDVLLPGLGDDAVGSGGSGVDTVSYAGAGDGGVTVDLSSDTATGAGTDTLSMIENAVGSGGDDVLVGDDGANAVDGGAGSDRLSGGAGNDVLTGGPGDDTVQGQAGTDAASYLLAPGGVNVDLNAFPQRAIGAAGSDTLSGIEDVAGSGFRDFLTGSFWTNSLSGLGGNDRLYGGKNLDHLNGGPGNDLLDGGDGFDTCFDVEGTNTLVNCDTFGPAGAVAKPDRNVEPGPESGFRAWRESRHQARAA